MSKIKYGIKIQLAVDDYIWVTEDNNKCGMFEMYPELYETFCEAQEAAKHWGPMAEVVIYDKDNIVS